MNIEPNKIFLNKTLSYLYPCLKFYNEEFTKLLNKLNVVAVGIGDYNLINFDVDYNHHLFILVNTEKNKLGFIDTIERLKDHISFEDDYAFDHVLENKLHMIVIKIPEEHYHSFDAFNHSQYSKMFNLKELNDYFNSYGKEKLKKVLVKDFEVKQEFVNYINLLFETDISPYEFNGELDMPLNKKNEIFNLKEEFLK